MNLTFNELKKRDVINVVDGKCLGNITDIDLTFPSGKLIGIVVPGKKINFFLKLFDKSKLYIPEENITKIGGDVILVNLSCGDTCENNVKLNPKNPPCNPCNPCKPILPCSSKGKDNVNNLGLDNLDLNDY